MQAMPSCTPLSRTASCTSSVMSVTVSPPVVRSFVSRWKTFTGGILRYGEGRRCGEPAPSGESACPKRLNVALRRISHGSGSIEFMPSVLFADDEPSFRSLFEIYLRSGGYDVRVASDGLEALASLTDHGVPDAVLLDVRMPRLDGPELCRVLRRLWPLLPIVLVSAEEHLETIGRNAGASATLAKPSSAGELCGLLSQLIQPPAAAA